MAKRVYISADYDEKEGDREVADVLNKWGSDDKHKVEFVDMAKVVSGSVANDPDCRMCDLKAEFNRQINASSTVIFIVGDKTKDRTAGSGCERNIKIQSQCYCTPYKKNALGAKVCKVASTCSVSAGQGLGSINSYSYLRHEFEQAKVQGKEIVIVYNSLNKQSTWLPWYMEDYKDIAVAFWTKNANGVKVGNYQLIKELLGYD